MEKKVCSYTEKNERLQLVAIWNDCGNMLLSFEIRVNRQVLYHFLPGQALHARLCFYHCVHELCINRSRAMLNLTS